MHKCLALPALWGGGGGGGGEEEESTGHRCFPFTKGQECQPLKFLWCYLEQIVQQTLEWPVISDAMKFMWRHYNDIVLH